MAVDVEKELTFIRNLPVFGQYLGRALRGIVDGINGLGQNLQTDATSTLPAPDPIQSLSVKSSGSGLVSVVINDSAPIQKNLHYFVEHDTNAAFSQPHVVHLGVSRSTTIMLPGLDDGGNPQNFHFRAFKQSPGGLPSVPVNFGSPGAPTPVAPGGTQKLTLLPSTGSGTASPNGQQGASGFGKTLFRPAQGPKRKGS